MDKTGPSVYTVVGETPPARIHWVPWGGRSWEGSLWEKVIFEKREQPAGGLWEGGTGEKNARPISVMRGGAEAEGADAGLLGPCGLS